MRAVLTYHSIDETGSPISVSSAQFAAHVRFLASDAVRVVGLEDLVTGAVHAGPTVAITFDDGFANFESHGLPLLRDHGLPSSQFVVTGHVGGSNAWQGREQPGIPKLPLLDWDALGRALEAGVTLGAHTHTHPNLTGLSGTALADELDQPIEVLRERLHTTPETFAYPYGDHDTVTDQEARARYRVVCTTELAPLRPDQDLQPIPRLDMYYFRDAGRLESIGTPRFRRYLGLRRVLRRVRSAVLGG